MARPEADLVIVRLRDLAAARSGDKGSSANIGVIARSPAIFSFLVGWLTPQRVLEYFRPLGPTGIQSHIFTKLEAINFTLEGVLAGGGSRSLRIDAQGKTLGQALLEMEVDLPVPLADTLLPERHGVHRHE